MKHENRLHNLPIDLKHNINNYLPQTQLKSRGSFNKYQTYFNKLLLRYFNENNGKRRREGIVEYVLGYDIGDIISNSLEVQLYNEIYGNDGFDFYIENNPDWLISAYHQYYKLLPQNKKIKLARAIEFELKHPLGPKPSKVSYNEMLKKIKDILE